MPRKEAMNSDMLVMIASIEIERPRTEAGTNSTRVL